MKARIVLWAVLPALNPAPPVLAMGSEPNPPTRLFVQVAERTVRSGESVTLRVGLRDAYDLPTPARKPYSILIQVFNRQTDPPLSSTTVVIGLGRDSVQTRVKLSQVGVLLIKASHPELREAAVFVAVRVGDGAVRRPRFARRPGPAVVRVAHWQRRLAQAQPVVSPGAPSPPTLVLRYAHEAAKLVANGRDADTISAFLSDSLSRELRIHLSAAGGQLHQHPIVIPAGKVEGFCDLTSTRPGQIRVRVESVQPGGVVQLVEGGAATATFGVPVKEVSLMLSPIQVPLGSAARIRACLIDIEGRPVATDVDRDLIIEFDHAGSLEPKDLRLLKAQGDSCADASFRPLVTGPIKLAATTFGATTRSERVIQVVWPPLVIWGLVIGGLAGGLVRAGQTWAARPVNWGAKALTEALGGVVVGTAAFAVSCLGILGATAASVACSPFGALVIAIAAAYAGASLLGVIAKLLFGV